MPSEFEMVCDAIGPFVEFTPGQVHIAGVQNHAVGTGIAQGLPEVGQVEFHDGQRTT